MTSRDLRKNRFQRKKKNMGSRCEDILPVVRFAANYIVSQRHADLKSAWLGFLLLDLKPVI